MSRHPAHHGQATRRAATAAGVALALLIAMVVVAVLATRTTTPDDDPTRDDGWPVEVQEEALAGTWVGQPDTEQDRMCAEVRAHGTAAAVDAFREDAPEFDPDVVARFFTDVCEARP